jgi:hypothetical protein
MNPRSRPFSRRSPQENGLDLFQKLGPKRIGRPFGEKSLRARRLGEFPAARFFASRQTLMPEGDQPHFHVDESRPHG